MFDGFGLHFWEGIATLPLATKAKQISECSYAFFK